ncbi:hypothetical protein GQ600_186 [Phytophthora cactorum]|nr:hypothetical protein GQ600_186 [Phytophthora cactorum]
MNFVSPGVWMDGTWYAAVKLVYARTKFTCGERLPFITACTAVSSSIGALTRPANTKNTTIARPKRCACQKGSPEEEKGKRCRKPGPKPKHKRKTAKPGSLANPSIAVT